MKQLINLTENQLNQLRNIVESTRGSRNKSVTFANAIEQLATRTVSTPKYRARIYRVRSHNYGTNQHPDWRDALISEGRFVRFNRRNAVMTVWRQGGNGVGTIYGKNGIFAGRFITVTDTAHEQLVRAFSDYIF